MLDHVIYTCLQTDSHDFEGSHGPNVETILHMAVEKANRNKRPIQ